METFAEQNRVTVLNWVSFDPIFTKAVVQGKTVIELDADSEGSRAVRNLWQGIQRERGV